MFSFQRYNFSFCALTDKENVIFFVDRTRLLSMSIVWYWVIVRKESQNNEKTFIAIVKCDNYVNIRQEISVMYKYPIQCILLKSNRKSQKDHRMWVPTLGCRMLDRG